MHAPPTTAVLAICVYLPRDVFFCFFGFAGAVGFFAAPGGFGLLGDTAPPLASGTPVDAVLCGRRSGCQRLELSSTARRFCCSCKTRT